MDTEIKNYIFQKTKFFKGLVKDMKPINDQINREYDFPNMMMAGEEIEQYRGQNRTKDWNYCYVRHIPVPRHPPKARNDGVTTKVTNGKKINTTVSKEVVVKQTFTVVEPKNNITQVHKANLCDILERRRRVAEAKADEKLLGLLEIEWQYMAC